MHYPRLDCKGCHTAGTKWSDATNLGHDPVPNQCSACHGEGEIYDSYPSPHIATGGADCIQCHTASINNGFTNWTGAKFLHTSTLVQNTSCTSCHGSGTSRDRFPTPHVPIGTTDCKACHQATVNGGFVDWKGAQFNHAPAVINANTCMSCHGNGGAKDSYPNTHVANGGQDCKSCHQASITNMFTNWKGAVFLHNEALVNQNTCTSCHGDSAPYDEFPSGHIAVGSTDCKTCHQATVTGGFKDWKNASFNHSSSVLALNTCKSCHADGAAKDSFPNDHIAVGAADCRDCHQASINNNFKDWKGGQFDHSPTLIAQKNCNSCHSSDRPGTGSFMAQDPALNVTDSHYGTYDCYFCHKTNQNWRDWNSSSTSHYEASGRKIESCLPCHFARERPQPNQRGNGPIGEHRNRTSWFTAPIYEINASGNHPGSKGKLGNCYACHNKRRRSFDE